MHTTHNSLYIILFFILVTWGEGELLSTEETRDLCNNMALPGHGLFSPLMCLTKNDAIQLSETSVNFAQDHQITDDKLEPVILIPGLGGSGLEASLSEDHKVAWYCYKAASWFRIWFSLEEFLVKKCWLNSLFISYNTTTGMYNNTPGVTVQPIDFGGVKGVAYLDLEFGHPIAATSVFAPIVDSLVKIGYTPGKNIRGAPFDWRMPATSEYKLGWYTKLQQLIEETYTMNGNRSVHIITHSLGGPTSLFFLNQMTQVWKDQYVRSYIPIAGPWSGAATALRAVVSGDNFGLTVLGHDLVSSLELREISRQAGGIVELIPNPQWWDPTTVFVTTNKRNYTMQDFPDLFSDMGSLATIAVYNDVSSIIANLQTPNVATYCIFGYGVPTEIAYTYPDGDFNKDPIIDDTDMGDGTVPLLSLQQCTKWAGLQFQPVVHRDYELLTHVNILKDKDVISYLLAIVTNQVY